LKLLEATLNIVKARGEPLFLDVSRPYAYTLVTEINRERMLIRIAQNAEDVSGSSIKDLKLLSSYTNVTSLCITSTVRGEILRRGVVYTRDNIAFISLSTFTDLVDGKPPMFRLNHGSITAAVDGKKLRQRREEAGISLGALAKELGVSRETVYRYEREEIEAPAKIAQKLIDMFGEDVIKKISIERVHVSAEELASRSLGKDTYKLVDSHPDALRVQDRVLFISTSADKFQKTVELANALGVEVEKSG